MSPDQFEAAEPLLDEIADIVEKQLADDKLGRLLGELRELMGSKITAALNITVEIWEDDGERSLPLLTTGLSVANREPFRTWGDSSPQRYVVENGIQVLPHDRCPVCWGVWDFKLQNPTCGECGTEMGATCKLLLDSDVCPWCNEGKVTLAKPRCDQCGFVADPKLVVWG